MNTRQTEIRDLLRLSPDEVRNRAGDQLVVCEDLDKLHQHMAEDILAEIRRQATRGEPARLILPVGPTGQYEILVERILQAGIKLSHCWFFFMDEYCDADGRSLSADHPLSFRRIAHELFLDQLPSECGLEPEQVIFPDENNIARLTQQISSLGGIDACFGGIGIHGHIAFNEPESGISEKTARRVRLNDFTVTMNAIRSHIGGNIENFPREAYTLGMVEILQARRIRLYCRNGSPYDWANTVLRLALFGEPGDDYPVTYIRDHQDIRIITDEETLASPQYIL